MKSPATVIIYVWMPKHTTRNARKPTQIIFQAFITFFFEFKTKICQTQTQLDFLKSSFHWRHRIEGIFFLFSSFVEELKTESEKTLADLVLVDLAERKRKKMFSSSKKKKRSKNEILCRFFLFAWLGIDYSHFVRSLLLTLGSTSHFLVVGIVLNNFFIVFRLFCSLLLHFSTKIQFFACRKKY